MTADLHLSAADLATLFRVPVGTIYYWAHDDHWRRTKGRPVLYHHADANASYARRRHGCP